MSTFVVPSLDEEPWPTLGPQVCDLIEDRAIHGPGDLLGQPAVIDAEKRALIHRMYQVYPRDHPRAGKRRFKRVGISLRKGSAKTELAAWVGFAELHPEGPVRTDGWNKVDGMWQPVGRPVTDPYIPMLAITEEQVEELAYGALLKMCQDGPDADLFDAGLERITRAYGDGKAEAMATAPNSNDGARTTWQHFDETHRMVLKRMKEAHQTMQNNIPKRVLSDAWSLETTTTYEVGAGSVAQGTHEYAELIDEGKAKDATLFFFHREAEPREDEDLEDVEQLKEAIREASGPALAQWEDFEGQVAAIASMYNQSDTDKSYWERVWLNRRVSSERQAFDVKQFLLLSREFEIPKGDPIAVGFDGSRWQDSTGLVLTDIDGNQTPFDVWEHDGTEDWQVPEAQVDAAIEEIFTRWNVVRFYGDPAQGWDDGISRWAGKYGPKKVMFFYTDSRNTKQIATACRAYSSAIRSSEVHYCGSARVEENVFTKHVANCRKRMTSLRDEDEQPLWVIEKERRDSPFKIDLAMCAVLSWRARLDALAKGEFKRRTPGRMIVMR